jgi:hypothetical protein
VADPLKAKPRVRFAVGSGYGQTAQVNVYDAATNAVVGILTPFGMGFSGGARVAVGDVNGDGIEDVIVGAGLGTSPMVKIYDGATLKEARSFLAYGAAFDGGVFVAVGDIDRDGRADVFTGAGAGGGPHVQVFTSADLFADTRALSPNGRLSFFAYAPAFSGGVSVATADLDGDGVDDVVTGAGAGGGPHVGVFSGKDHAALASFFAYDQAMRTGILVTAGNIDDDEAIEIVTSPMKNGSAHLRVFEDGETVADLFPFGGALTGAAVAARDVDGDGVDDLLVAAGPGPGPRVVVLDAATGSIFRDFPAFMPQFTGGSFVG